VKRIEKEEKEGIVEREELLKIKYEEIEAAKFEQANLRSFNQ